MIPQHIGRYENTRPLGRARMALVILLVSILLAGCGLLANANRPTATEEILPAATHTLNPEEFATAVHGTVIAAANLTATAMSTPAPTSALRYAEIAELRPIVDWQLTIEETWNPAALGQTLSIGNQVRTGDDGHAKIIFSEGTITRLDESSLFAIAELPGDSTNPIIRLKLVVGQLFVILGDTPGAGSAFEVETPAGVAAVRGSYMSVLLTSGRMIVTCLEGFCNLSNAMGAVDLTQGQQASIDPSQPPQGPLPMEDDQFNAWIKAHPKSVSVAVSIGVIEASRLPPGCNLVTGIGCYNLLTPTPTQQLPAPATTIPTNPPVPLPANTPTPEFEITTQTFPVYFCAHLGNNVFEWYEVEVTYHDGVPVSETVVDGPLTGAWQSGCPAGEPTSEPSVEEPPPTATPCVIITGQKC